MGILTLNITNCTDIYEICTTNIDGATISSSGYSKISAGELQLSEGILGNYVIEWRLDAVDGEIQFISGNATNTDPDISQFHPFVDEIVSGGVIYPVIKYVYVDGMRYDGYYSEGAKYSPDLRLCLTSTEVESMVCEGGNSTATYSHTLSYDFSNPNGTSSRETIFKIPNDGSEKYLAFKFNAVDVADMVKFYAVTEGPSDIVDTLINVVSGEKQTSRGLIDSSDPLYTEGEDTYRVAWDYYQYVINLSGITCDYVRIIVTSSVDEPANLATKWYLDFKCLYTFPCDYIVNTGWTLNVSGITSEWETSACRYKFTLPPIESPVYNPLYQKYIGLTRLNDDVEYLDWNAQGRTSWDEYNNISCTSLDGTTYTRDKANEKLTISFDNYNSYIKAKGYYDAAKASILPTYVNDNTDINFYKYFYLYQKFRTQDLNCNEDEFISRHLSFHISSPVTFNNVPGDYYMEILTPTNITDPTNTYPTHYPITNGLTDSPCSSVYESASSFANTSNSLFNYASFVDSTNFADEYFMAGRYLITVNVNETYEHDASYVTISDVALDEVCPNFEGSGNDSNAYKVNSGYENRGLASSYRVYKHCVKIVLTGANKYNGQSVGDYDIFSTLNTTTGLPDYTGGSDVLIKRVIGGVDQSI